MSLENKELKELFRLADKIGSKRYHKLTAQDFQDYLKFNHWRYINGQTFGLFAVAVTAKKGKSIGTNTNNICTTTIPRIIL